MSAHLTSREISEWTAGTRTEEREDHLHECAECRGELAGLQLTFHEFRESMRGWGAQQGTVPRPMWRTEPPVVSHRLRWMLVAVAMLVLAAIPVYRSRVQPQRVDTVDDTVLMEQIDAGVSRSVPAPMEPLTNLMAEEPAGTQTKTKK